MYSLGACVLPPLDRHLTPLSAELRSVIDAADRPAGRVLVMGGATSQVIELLERRGQTVTVAERACWVEAAQKVWPAAETVAVDSWEGLDDFPLGWFNEVLLLGGVMETGGPWWTGSVDAWSTERSTVMPKLLGLICSGGVILADHAGDYVAGTLTFAAQGETNGQTSISFATIVDEGRSVVLTTHRYRDGVEDCCELRTAGRAPWSNSVAGVAVDAVSPGVWSLTKSQEASA